MPVRYTPPTPEELLPVPGVALGTAAARHQELAARRRAAGRVRRRAPRAAGVFTQNRFCAAPVIVCRRASRARRRASARWSSTPATPTPAPAQRGIAARARPPAPRSRDCSAARRSEVLPFSTGVIMEPLPVDEDRRRRCRACAGGARAPTTGSRRCRAIMTTDTVPKGASRRVDGRRRAGHRHRHRQGRRHDPSRTWRRCSSSSRPTRRSPPALLATLDARDRRRLVQLRDRSTATRRPTTASCSSRPGARRWRRSRDAGDPRLAAAARRARRPWRPSSRRRSSATARARPSSSPSRVEGGRDAGGMPAGRARASRIRRWSRPRSSRPTRTSAASSARSATRRRRTSIRRACRSGSTTCWSSSDGGRAPSYREEDGQRVMKQRRDHRPRRARPRRRVGDGLDLRFLARLRQHQRRLPELGRA